MKSPAAALVLAAALAGCSAAPAPAPPPVAGAGAEPRAPQAPRDPDAGNAPAPYTAEQLRAACREGRTITFVTEAPGKPPQQRRMRFLAVDDERATIADEVLDDTGKVVGTPETQVSTWEELRRHASFPMESTTITEAVAEVPAGSFPCKRYTVVEGNKKRRMCFANDLPGPPVEMTIEEDGKLVLSMELLKNEPGK